MTAIRRLDNSPSPPVLEATAARQGRRGRHALTILLVSLALVAVALWGSWAAHAPSLASVDPTPSHMSVAARSFDAPAPADATRQSGAPDQ